MWFYKFEFDCKEESLNDQDLSNIDGYLSGDLSSKEIEDLIYLENKTKSKINYNDWQMPSIQLPEEYKELLSYSNGGHITNGERQFGFFGMQELRSYYIRYLFIEYMCGALPIAFDGGGIFFAYDFRAKIPKIIATESGVLNWEQSAYLGDNLLEVLTAKHNISDELYILTHEQKKKLEDQYKENKKHNAFIESVKKSNELFKQKKYSDVVSLLAEYESKLDKLTLSKFNYSKKKI